MKVQLEQLDLLRPWPELVLRDGYRTMVILVRVGAIPIGEVFARPARRRVVSHRGLRKRIAQKHSVALLKAILHEGLTVGPEALTSVAAELFPKYTMVGAPAARTRHYVEETLLLPGGLPEPYRSWVEIAQRQQAWPMPPVTVAVCTRDRAEILEGCIENLKALDYPDFEILIVDNGRDPVPAREISDRLGVSYVRCLKPGLSRARNAAIAAARHEWIAFTDDDCRPERNWLKELIRPTQDSNCRCVCGLVLPAQLENSAEITFEIYGGLGRGYAAKLFDPGFLRASKTRPAQTWRIGAGANMLLHRGFAQWIGGYDVDMGPGPSSVGGCGEDTDVFYQVLRTGHNIHYAPRAIVHHFHRSSPAALRKQIYSYAVGHAAYHARCLFRYGDHRSLIQLAYHLPRWFARNLKRGIAGSTKYPFSLVFLEIRGTAVGPFQYGFAKARRLWRKWTAKPQAVVSVAPAPAPAPDSKPRREEPVSKSSRGITYDAVAGTKSFRAA